MLHDFISMNRQEILGRCRTMVGARLVPSLTDAGIDCGVPVFLDQLADALRRHMIPSPEIARRAVQHGLERLRQGFTLSQVVHDCDIRQAIVELALERNAPVGADDFCTLNRCVDEAIADAVTEFGREQNQSTLDRETARWAEREGFLAHEMRNLLNTAFVAFEVLKTGDVGVGGSTGAVLHRSLMGARALTGRSLAEARLTHGAQRVEHIHVAGFIDELALAAAMEGSTRGITLRVMPVDDAVVVEADRQILMAVLVNLLQNAFKFTRAGTTVVLSVGASAERVLVEIQDECGGLPSGNVDELFRPFEQRGSDRSGLGLGLAFSRAGIEASHGRIYAHDLAGRGCVFGIDLPRIPLSAFATV
jgi:signal transduction histidine kinase